MNSREIISRLVAEGWRLARIRGSHHQFLHPEERSRRVTVPHPRKDLPRGTLRSIYRQAGWIEP